MRVRDKSKTAFARRLRSTLTPPEARMWVRLRVRDNDGITFRRQHPIGSYVLDFYCAQAKLAIEVDGSIHTIDAQIRKDEVRDAWLLSQGIETIRIPAIEIMRDPDEIALGVLLLCQERAGRT